MKKPVIMRYVNLVSRWRKFKINANRVMACVLGNNKKIKKGGASPVNGEIFTTRVEMNGTDLFVTINRNG